MSAFPPTTPSARRPLVVSEDDGVLDELLRVLAAAGAEPEVATGGPALRRAYRAASLVLVGADALDAPAVRALPRRPGVVVVGRAEPSVTQWAVAVELGAERVAVLPEDEAWLLAKVAGAARAPVQRGWLAAVGGSCGGAGASSVATALALAAAADGDVLLVDADPSGGGLDLLLGAECAEGLRWPELTGLRGRVDGRALLAALPEVAGVHLLTGARTEACRLPEEALVAVVGAARDAGCPVVVDVPRGDPSAETVLAEADLAALVVPARLRAACAARLLVDRPDTAWSAGRLVVRRVPGGLAPGEVAEMVGRPLLAELPHDRGAVPRGEAGRLPGTGRRSLWGGVAARLLAEAREGARQGADG